jgi:prevent-host-death family protein
MEMPIVPSRELRNDTAGVLKRVATGQEVTITQRGRPVARLVPISTEHRRWLPREVLAERLRVAQADPALRDDLAWIAGETTDDLPPLR